MSQPNDPFALALWRCLGICHEASKIAGSCLFSCVFVCLFVGLFVSSLVCLLACLLACLFARLLATQKLSKVGSGWPWCWETSSEDFGDFGEPPRRKRSRTSALPTQFHGPTRGNNTLRGSPTSHFQGSRRFALTRSSRPGAADRLTSFDSEGGQGPSG